MQRLKFLWNAFCCLSLVVLGCFLFIVPGPRLAGGAYSVLAIPFYNLTCSTQRASSFPAALLSLPPTADDYSSFLLNRGCSLSDAEERFQKQAAGSDPYSNLQNFWSNDVVSNLFNNIGQIMEKGFVEGAVDTSRSLIPIMQENVLAKPAYFLVYIVLVAVLGYELNQFVHSKLKREPKTAA